ELIGGRFVRERGGAAAEFDAVERRPGRREPIYRRLEVQQDAGLLVRQPVRVLDREKGRVTAADTALARADMELAEPRDLDAEINTYLADRVPKVLERPVGVRT